MSVTRVHEDPRVTKPYTEEQWAQVDALGRQVDEALHAADVRLTMGGEPTFVSIDDMEGGEWNFDALGPTKRLLANDLLGRMQERFAPGALLHYGQGKWYPGEPLPRWALSCYWRRDGQPIWRDPELIANERVTYGHDSTEARAFISTLAEKLRVEPDLAIPAYEDVWHYLLKERRLPLNVDPLQSRLDDPQERDRLARIFEQGLDRVVGYALPLQYDDSSPQPGWRSGPWRFRQEHMYLLPGDSSMGFRLPLDSLPWSAPEDRTPLHDLDPFAPRGPLPETPAPAAQPYVVSPHAAGPANGRQPAAASARRLHSGGEPYDFDQAMEALGEAKAAPAQTALLEAGQSAKQVVRTSLCVEAREGRLHVFLPPLRRVEEYLELVACVEQTAAELSLPVVIEGYLPPRDERLNHFRIAPDPGVIEVNVHPAHSWDELVANTTGVYEDARHSRLGADKFMVDGKHAGTGGGNHVVLGGSTPADSPFLRRPDLLRSLLAYWNNHPSLSYLFSGTFIGPTSQAPRVDEARHESLYELEIAFRQIPEQGECPPWLVDRVFRHLLTDLTGNTHRAEFCIDKLFSPDSAAGRLGLVEFRAFEMPPHPRMSLVQQLLLRALIARFWRQPYRQKLVRWGTVLHDRFLLPHFVSQDFCEVIDELRFAGYPFEHEWFAFAV